MLRRYLLCIEAPSPVAGQVNDLGALLMPVISRPRRTTAPVHITLLLADLDEELGPALIKAIATGLANARSFGLSFRGITHFKDERTIYADPVEKTVILELLKPIAAAISAEPALAAQSIQVTDGPHMTIASNLKPPQFSKAWALLGQREFKAVFRVDHLVLMERPLTSGSVYSALESFPLTR